MSNLNQLLKQEIKKVARQEIRETVIPLKKKVREQAEKIEFLMKKLGNPVIPEKKEAEEGQEKSIRLNNTRIRKLRVKLGLTQEKFAQLLNVNQLTVCHWESGKHVPHIFQKRRMVEIRDMKKADLQKLLTEKFASALPEVKAAPVPKTVKKAAGKAAKKAAPKAAPEAAPAPKAAEEVKK